MAVGPDRPTIDADYEAWEMQQRKDDMQVCVDCEEEFDGGALNDEGVCQECEFAADIRASERLRDNVGDR